MPATFPSHQGIVLPLKLWRPRWFDGVALCAGAAAPDLAYLLDGSGLPVWPFSHQWLGLVGWCLPVTVVLAWILRRAAPIVAAHLPTGGRLALRDYGALASIRPAWWITASSALLGGASHLALDGLDLLGPGGEWAGHLAGGGATLGVLVHMGRRRLIVDWHGPAAVVRLRPRRFWGSAAIVGLAGFGVVPFLPAAFLAHTTGVRLTAVVALALLAGAAAAGEKWGTGPA